MVKKNRIKILFNKNFILTINNKFIGNTIIKTCNDTFIEKFHLVKAYLLMHGFSSKYWEYDF
jgi:hypothetical protein